MGACATLLCFVLAADDIRLTPEERHSEVERLSSLGLKVPEGGPLLETPYAEPYTFRSFLAPSTWWRGPQPQEVSAAALRQDLAVLHALMQKAYGGWASAEARGWDWNRWFADWDRDLASRGDAKLPLAEAMAPIGKLMAFQLDNHTGLVGGGVLFGSGSRTAVLASAPSGTCTEMRTADGKTFPLDPNDPAQWPRRARIQTDTEKDGYFFKYPARRGNAEAIRCGSGWVAVQTTADAGRDKAIAELAQKPAGEHSYRTISEKIGYLRIADLSKANNEQLRKLLPTLPASAGKEKLLIVDLRQNGGGDNVLEMMNRWLDVSMRQALRGNRSQPKSCLYDALRWGYSQVTTFNVKPPLSDQLRGSLQAQLNALFKPSPEGCPVNVVHTTAAWDYRKHDATAAPSKTKPRLLLLVDNGCGSDCEYMTYVMSAEPGTVVAGENTHGVGQFVQPGYFILPRTRVRFRIALGMSDTYGDNRSFDGYGLDADIVLASEAAQSAEGILKLAQRMIN